MEHVLICVAWPYANGPLHLGHVAGCYLPPDLQARYERMRGRRVLMVSGSDEHGTPITVSAEERGVTPQSIVDHYHAINSKALERLGCLWPQNIDARGVEYGGALFNRTSDPGHIERTCARICSTSRRQDCSNGHRWTSTTRCARTVAAASYRTATSKATALRVVRTVLVETSAMHVVRPTIRTNY